MYVSSFRLKDFSRSGFVKKSISITISDIILEFKFKFSMVKQKNHTHENIKNLIVNRFISWKTAKRNDKRRKYLSVKLCT